MLGNQRARLARSVSLLTLIAALSPAPATAQQVGTSGATALGTILVTGDNLVRDLMETPSSVSVVTADELERGRAGRDDVRTVIAGTPNVIYTDSVSSPVIRGQNSEGPHDGATAFFAGTVPRATINLDGHYLNYYELNFGATSIWDLDSIEVFRGPQTTSQGANAIAGAIVANTNDPTFAPEGAYRLEFGNYSQRRASFAWSGPLNEQLAARIALDYSSRDTFIDYVSPGFIQNEIGQDFESLNARAKLLWRPTDIDGLEVRLTFSHSDVVRPTNEGAAPDPRYEDLRSTAIWMPGWDQTTQSGVLDVDYDFGNGIVFTNRTEVSTSDIERRVGTPTAGDAEILQDTYSNDARLTFGTSEDVFSGVAGFYVGDTSSDEMLNQGGISTFEDRKRSLGLYGELSWRIDDRWTLTGGLRYQRDQIRRQGSVSPLFANSDVDFDETFDAFLPRLALSYAVTPDWTVGGMISRGYNPGGVSLDFAGTRGWTTFEEETVWNYELFTRASLLEDRLFVSSNIFYMDYRNAQHSVSRVIDGVAHIQTFNADRARSYGLELAADYRPTDALTLRASIGLMDTRLTEMTNYPAYEGNEFSRAPGRTFSLGASWDVNDRLNLSGQLRFVDGYYSDAANTPAYEVDSYRLVDVQGSYQLNNGIELYGYVNNVFDERSPVLLSAARGLVPFTQASMTAPRMVGIGIRGRF